eukprot:tig00021760_g23432.t1
MFAPFPPGAAQIAPTPILFTPGSWPLGCQSCPALERRIVDLEATVAVLHRELEAVKAVIRLQTPRPSPTPNNDSALTSSSAKRRKRKRKAALPATSDKRPCPTPAEESSSAAGAPCSADATPSLGSNSSIEGGDLGMPELTSVALDGSRGAGTAGRTDAMCVEDLAAGSASFGALSSSHTSPAQRSQASVSPPDLSSAPAPSVFSASPLRRPPADVLATIRPGGRSSFSSFCSAADSIAGSIAARAVPGPAVGAAQPQAPQRPAALVPADPLGLVIGRHPKDGAPVRLPPALSACLRPHQVEGIRFMWCHLAGGEAAASAPRPAPDSPLRFVGEPGGCVLADHMGLGKTLQVVALSQALYAAGAARTILVLCPATVVRSWEDEFARWLRPRCPPEAVPPVHSFERARSRTREERVAALAAWHRQGGVFLVNYDMFRRLAQDGDSALREPLCAPGPDVVVADEGHKLKDLGAAVSRALASVATPRRAVLTGYPLQNNLTEYYSMLEFVRPGCLGGVHHFRLCFERPVLRASFPRATPAQISHGRRRAWLLHDALRPIVLRRDATILQSQLPRKVEVTLRLRPSEEQVALYRLLVAAIKSGDFTNRVHFWAYDALVMLLGHPDILRAYAAARLAAPPAPSASASASASAAEASASSSSSAVAAALDADDSDCELVEPPSAPAAAAAAAPWCAPGAELIASRLVWLEAALAEMRYDERAAHSLHVSPKMLMLLHIAVHSKARGDRLVVFTRSLDAFRYIEGALARHNALLLARGAPARALLAVDGFHGQVPLAERAARIARLNDPAAACDVFVISTLAGGEGITLTGANRVVLFDVSWNPCHDVEAACRVYRFGQTKTVHIYRLVTAGTIEEKVYARQLAKMGVAKWVVDDSNVRPCPPVEDADLDRLLAEPARELQSMLETEDLAPLASSSSSGAGPDEPPAGYGDDLVDALVAAYGRGPACPLIDVARGESLFEAGPEEHAVCGGDRELARIEFGADSTAVARAFCFRAKL